MDSQSIGSRLKIARGKRTQQEVIDELRDITCVQTLSSYECDKTRPPLEILAKLAKFYDVSTDWLLFGEEYTPKTPKDGASFLFQFVEAADKFNFRFGTGNNPTIALDSYNWSVTDFMNSWVKFRELLESGAVSQDMYNTMIAYSISKVDFFKNGKPRNEREKANFPFGWVEVKGTPAPNPVCTPMRIEDWKKG